MFYKLIFVKMNIYVFKLKASHVISYSNRILNDHIVPGLLKWGAHKCPIDSCLD